MRRPVDPASFAGVTRADDPRLAQSCRALADFSQLSPGALVLIGAPDDRGIAVHGGRPGAALAPQAIRVAFYRMPGVWPLWDAGDVQPGADNVETQARLAQIVARVVQAGALPIVLGGSHDLTYGGVCGLAAAGVHPAVMNWDAHLDLRPVTTDAAGNVNSGCAFRRLIDDRIISGASLWEIGIAEHAASAQHVEWAHAQGVHVWKWHDLQSPDLPTMTQQLCAGTGADSAPLAISFDCDLLAASGAPGVSAPAMLGLSAADAIGCFQLFARQPHLCYLDLMECSPPHDVGGMTVRLVATLLWFFCHTRLGGV